MFGFEIGQRVRVVSKDSKYGGKEGKIINFRSGFHYSICVNLPGKKKNEGVWLNANELEKLV